MREKIANILTGESCKTLAINKPCNYELKQEDDCRECQADQIIDLLKQEGYGKMVKCPEYQIVNCGDCIECPAYATVDCDVFEPIGGKE